MTDAYDLKPWTKVAVPHDDILGGDFDLSSYAANLGQVDGEAARCPVVYRDPVAFYEATYLTSALDELLRDVAGVLAGGAGNRVLQLHTPFGGGKTHTLIALLHLARHREALRAAGWCDDYPDPGPTRVVVLPCLDLDAAGGRQVDGIHVRTLWGELAMRAGGPDAYAIVQAADELRVNPGGDLLRQVLDGQPTLILLDEVLTYVEAAFGVPIGGSGGDTNLGRQCLMFLQYLTEVVRGLPHCAMVYSLQRSVGEAVGDEQLLQMLDNLVSRVDAKREPVTGDEVLHVVQRRLFKDLGPRGTREAVAREYGALLSAYCAQTAQTESEKRAAQDVGVRLTERVMRSYPFHPELLDLMYHRWGSLPSYQRTRGALQFLATVVGALWRQGEGVSPLIGPGDVPLHANMVRNTFFSQVGEREAMKAVLDADLLGTGARCQKVDRAIEDDVPAYQSYRIGTRLTRALALYSFGAKPGEDRGVLRADLLAASQLPGLPGDVLDDALDRLTVTLLYIHGSGRRYRFEKRPNLNKLIEEELDKIKAHEVREAVRKAFLAELGDAPGHAIWPASPAAVVDAPRFQAVFWGPGHALGDHDTLAMTWLEQSDGGKRTYKNALCFVVPDKGKLDAAYEAARKQCAIQRLLDERRQRAFEKDDIDDLTRRRKSVDDALAAAARQIYARLLLPIAAPRESAAPIGMKSFDIRSYQALSGGLIETVHQVLKNWLFEAATPDKLVASVRLGGDDLGAPSQWIAGPALTREFFGSVQYPKLRGLDGLRQTVARGVSTGKLGYVMGGHEAEGRLVVDRPEALTFRREVAADDIDLSEGSYIVSKPLAEALTARFAAAAAKPGSATTTTKLPSGTDGSGNVGGDVLVVQPDSADEEAAGVGEAGSRTAGGDATGGADGMIRLRFEADSIQFFRAYRALQVLSDMVPDFVAEVRIEGEKPAGFDQNKYLMSVLLALREADIEVDES